MVKPTVFVAIGGGAAVAIAITFLLVLHTNTPQYALSVEPRTEMVMGANTNVRVYVQNTGSQPLTNINLNWGSTSDNLLVLNPGERVMFSPPSSATMVTVTADHGINIMKPLMDSMK